MCICDWPDAGSPGLTRLLNEFWLLFVPDHSREPQLSQCFCYISALCTCTVFLMSSLVSPILQITKFSPYCVSFLSVFVTRPMFVYFRGRTKVKNYYTGNGEHVSLTLALSCFAPSTVKDIKIKLQSFNEVLNALMQFVTSLTFLTWEDWVTVLMFRRYCLPPYSPYLYLGISEMWCWLGGREYWKKTVSVLQYCVLL